MRRGELEQFPFIEEMKVVGRIVPGQREKGACRQIRPRLKASQGKS